MPPAAGRERSSEPFQILPQLARGASIVQLVRVRLRVLQIGSKLAGGAEADLNRMEHRSELAFVAAFEELNDFF
ncbi:MAG TPA: hypothetical protein VFJ90_13530 [Candidatus Didemnitutus sp.]|nr:hypothetical protein [Candidatus Didemnitutus sp.]